MIEQIPGQEMTPEIRVTTAHLRELGWCVSGARKWCARNGISFDDFIRDGIPVSRVEACKDAMGLQMAAIARKEAEDDDGR